MPSRAEQPSTKTITRDNALELLRSGSPHERLRGARHFAREASPQDASVLREFHVKETDSYVLRTLDLAISRSYPAPDASLTSVIPDSDFEQSKRARVEAINWISGLLLHEIASPIGLIEEAASRELRDYGQSQVKERIFHLRTVFAGIEQLRNASSTPLAVDFDLASWLTNLVDSEELAQGQPVTYHGVNPFVVRADPKLLRFAFCNGFKNAVEAVSEMEHDQAHPLLVTWGKSDSDFWLVVRDRGPGVSGPTQLIFDIGKTTKQNHIGFGLAIARLAMESMEGTVTLQPGKGSGAVYELRWPRQ